MDASDAADRIEEVRTEVLILFHPSDEPAPRERLGRLDWILLSPLARLRARGKFSGERGQSVLLAPDAKFKAERILVMGLGGRADLSWTAYYRLSYQTAQTVLDLRCTRIVLDLPYRAFPQEPPERVRRAFLEGFAAELARGRPEVEFAVSVLPPSRSNRRPPAARGAI
jgi:hypothetical protein